MAERVNDETREGWLVRAAAALAPLFEGIGREVPPIRVSVGFPSRSPRRVVGQCWVAEASEDGVNQIFVTPIRGRGQTIEVLGTLLHEMIHAVDNCQSGHRGDYMRMARQLGMTAPWKTTTLGDELRERLVVLAEELGPFPNGAMQLEAAAAAGAKQTTRMLKIQCPDCEYTARTTAKWLEMGLPTCPCGTEMIQA